MSWGTLPTVGAGGDGAGGGRAGPLAAVRRAMRHPPARPWDGGWHDLVNLGVVPLIAAMCLGGVLRVPGADPLALTWFFTAYIVFDLGWVWTVPSCVPSAPRVVAVHHVVTLLLLMHPLRVPEHAIFTCYAGLVEFDTAFLIAKRQFALSWLSRDQVNRLYWLLFLALRIVMQPVLLRAFILEPGVGPEIVAAQGFMTLLNLAMLFIKVRAMLQKRGARADTAAQAQTQAQVQAQAQTQASKKTPGGATAKES